MNQINFPYVPANNLIPLFQLDFATQGQPAAEQQQSLLIGNTVTASPEVPTLISSVQQAVALYGSGSVLAAMCGRYLAGDPGGVLWALPVADAGGATKASGTIVFSGTTTAAGVLALYIAGYSIPVAIASGQTAAQVTAAVGAALNAYIVLPPSTKPFSGGTTPPVIATISSATVTLTAVNAGTQGNAIDIRLNYYGAQNGEATPAGLTVAITAMAGGASDPVITGLDPILAGTNYDFIAVPWSTTAQLNAMQTLMSSATGRWSYLEQIYGHVWAAVMDADATGNTNLAIGLARNDPHCVLFSYEPAPPPPWEVAAGAMAACAASLRNDPPRPVQTLALPSALLAPARGTRYTTSVRQALLAAGLGLFRYNPDGTIQILRAVTTYKTNPQGVPDQSYRDTETLYTAMSVVRTLKDDCLIAFPRAKLADDGQSFGPGTSFNAGAPDQNIVTPNSARATIIASYQGMVDDGWVEDVATFAKGLIVQRNANDASRLDVFFDPIFLSGLRTLAVLTQFYLQSPAAA